MKYPAGMPRRHAPVPSRPPLANAELAVLERIWSEGPVTARITASTLQLHPRAVVALDEAAASKLKQADYYRWVQEQKQKLADARSQVSFLRRPVGKR